MGIIASGRGMASKKPGDLVLERHKP